MPDPPPVTTAFLPSSENMGGTLAKKFHPGKTIAADSIRRMD
jgi:hypothetical protein